MEELQTAERPRPREPTSARFVAVVVVSVVFFLACGLATITHRDQAASDMLANFPIPKHSRDGGLSRQEQTERILKMIAESSQLRKARAELRADPQEDTSLSTLLRWRIAEPLKDKSRQTSQVVQALWGLKIHGQMEVRDISPSTCSTSGRCRIVISGKEFGVPGRFNNRVAQHKITIQVGQTECSQMLWYSERKLKCLVGPGIGGDLNVTVQITEQPYGEVAVMQHAFSYDPPDVTKLNPDSLTVGQSSWIDIKGFNFGHEDSSPAATIGGKPCNETKWVSDGSILCLAPAFQDLSIQELVVDIDGQNQSAKVPVKMINIPANWPFDELTLNTEPWKITTAVMMDRTGYSENFFQQNSGVILRDDSASWNHLSSHSTLDSSQMVAVQMFRRYLNEHFNANHTHLETIDGVYVKDEGSHLDGDVTHDKKAIAKQLQLLEAETGNTLSELAPIVGDIVKEVPTCVGYPDCEMSNSVGHRGWTWHWHYSKARGWRWEYREIAEGDQPPSSCPFCDPVKVHANHTLVFTKSRMEYCFTCSNNSFANLLQPDCLTFRTMCLQRPEPGDKLAYAESQPDRKSVV